MDSGVMVVKQRSLDLQFLRQKGFKLIVNVVYYGFPATRGFKKRFINTFIQIIIASVLKKKNNLQ